MFRRFRHNIELSLLLFVAFPPGLGWSAETSVNPVPASPRATKWMRLTSRRPSPRVIPVSYSAPFEWHDNVVDGYEVFSPKRRADSHPKLIEPVRCYVNKIRFWFYYISGHGPAIWDRDCL